MENEIKSLREIIEAMQKELYDIKTNQDANKSEIATKFETFKKDFTIDVLTKYFEDNKKETPKEEPKEEEIDTEW